MPQDDLKIIEACLLGNTEAFSQIIDKYKAMVYNLAYRMCGDYHESEDITQDAFIKTYQSLSHYNPAYRFSTWLYQISLNMIRDRIKRKNIESISIDTSLTQGKDLKDGLASKDESQPEEYLVNRDQRQAIQQAIMSLPLTYREIIVLRHLEDLSYHQLASILKISPQTVKVRLYRARRELKKFLQNF